MLLTQALSGFQFNNHLGVNEQISKIISYFLPVIVNPYVFLHLHCHAVFLELIGKGILINLFKKTVTKHIIDLEKTADNFLSHVYMQHRISPDLLSSAFTACTAFH